MKTKLVGVLTLVFLLMIQVSFAQSASEMPKVAKGMIKVSILYPNGEGKTFDMDYYASKHMPLVKSLYGENVKIISIDKGIANGVPNAPVPYLAVGYLYFDSMASLQAAMGSSASAKLMADIPNFTNTQPVIQISEVLQ